MDQVDKFRFPPCSKIIISGSSQSGKSTMVRKIIAARNEIFDNPPEDIFYVYVYHQPFHQELPEVNFVQNIPGNLDPDRSSLVIFDDFLANPSKLKEISAFFVGASHHWNSSVIFITQNLFLNDPVYRTISLNSTSFIIFRSVRIADQLQILSRQLFGKNKSHLLPTIYSDACRKPFTYILIDLSQGCPDKFRIRTNVLPKEGPEIVYEA